MYNKDVREHVITLLSPFFGGQRNLKDSVLLQLFSLVHEMRNCNSGHLDSTYNTVINAFSDYSDGYLNIKRAFPPDIFDMVAEELLRFSYTDFLIYVVPGMVCDPQRTVVTFQKIQPGMSYIEQTHHIIRIKLIAYQGESIIAQDDSNNDRSTVQLLYTSYMSQERKVKFTQQEFQKLYASINTFELSPKSLSPHLQGTGSRDKHLENLMSHLTDELQLTREQQLSLVARCFVNEEQAADIIPEEPIYNFTKEKEITERKTLGNKAHKLMAKIPPLELICAISTRKKIGSVSTKTGTEALIVPNDVMLETGFVYPMFMNLIGLEKENRILLVYPSAHFVRELIAEESLRERDITIVLQDDNAVALLRYQVVDAAYATHFDKHKIISTKELTKRIAGTNLSYNKVFLFGNNLSPEEQRRQVVRFLGTECENMDIFALLSAYTIDRAEALGGAGVQLMPYIQTISLIPQGINNSSFPKRKLWVHFCGNTAIKQQSVKIYAYTLDKSSDTQKMLLSSEAPIEIARDDILRLNKSVRMHYTSEVLSRRAQGKTKDKPISHDITPDIPVWCSISFPKGKDNPRLEAYVRMPSEREDSQKGDIIQSTKKHTTQVPESDMLNWLENIYPFSYVQQRSTDTKSVEGDTKQIKIEISIREEVIDHYTPLLEKKNIALKTLWYLYPDLSNKYTGSDYQVLTEMMYTVIGQQRVCDITSELIEELLLEVYPNLNEPALWRNYKILSIAMEKAKTEKYCVHNPLEDALREEKLRRKLFAQVRKNMVKKHLEKPELNMVYHEIVSKITAGQYEYVGVLIRLLTGLESGIVCALRWRDIVQYPCLNVAAIAIIRQVSNDGKDVLGFSDSEDYIIFPLPDGLRARLEKHHKDLGDIPDDTRILDSIITLSSGAVKSLTPARLNDLTKGILSKFKVDDDYYIAYGNNEFRKTNLNKYMGDFIRENFRYWASKGAQLLPAELSVLLRNRVDSTCGRFYCDLQEEASLAIIAAKLSRLECLFMHAEQPLSRRGTMDGVYTYESEVMPQNGYRQKVSIEVKGESIIEVYANSPRGINSSSSILVDEEGNPI